mgnify:FL=1|jgi:hypothetical protein
MVEWLAGNRIRGTSAEKPSGSLQSPSVGGWKEVGRTTLGSAGATISVTGLEDKRYYMTLIDSLNSGVVGGYGRLNGDSGNNYSRRRSEDGGSDATNVNNIAMNYFGQDVSDGHAFTVGYLANKSDKEKLSITHSVWGNTAGAGNAPHRMEDSGKWANTTDPISSYQVVNLANSNNFASGAECVVLGYDPDDTHTTNFWEELASVELGSAGTVLSSGTFTAKKYLWVQAFIDSSGGNVNDAFRCGNGSVDTGTNYSWRFSANGGSDATYASQDDIGDFSNIANGQFINMFIINNASNEKLIMCHINEGKTGAGTAPTRLEIVGKWANTSDQINIVEWRNPASTNYSTKSIIKVWGSN